MTTDIIRQTFKLAKAARETHEDEISEAYKFTRPNRDIWRNRESHTDRTKIYDSTAPDSVQNLVSTILNLLILQQVMNYIRKSGQITRSLYTVLLKAIV